MPKKQVVIIHGGTSFKNHAAYLRFLKNEKIAPWSLKPGESWKRSIEQKLGRGYDVVQPRMPNGQNAKYPEWKLWFEKIFPLLNKEVILVGHSLGGLFLAKYLSENKFPKKIKALILIAAPFSKADKKVDPSDFAQLRNLSKVGEQAMAIHLFYSSDDHMVPYSEAKRYLADLPLAKIHSFSNKAHFNQATFPELVRLIKGLNKK